MEAENDITFETEESWKKRLKNILLSDYEHDVYEEVSFKNPETKPGRVDLYVSTHPDWPHQTLFPVIGIECKFMDKTGMSWLINSKDQAHRYMHAENIFRYNGVELPPLSICLIATPESWHEGIIYRWNGPGVQPCCWKSMTFFFERILLKVDCSILLNKRFHSNKGGGPIKEYYLGT